MSKYYEIKYPLERPGVKKRWIRIGSATAAEGEHGPVIMGTIEAVPVNWNGEFMLVEAGTREAKRMAEDPPKKPEGESE